MMPKRKSYDVSTEQFVAAYHEAVEKGQTVVDLAKVLDMPVPLVYNRVSEYRRKGTLNGKLKRANASAGRKRTKTRDTIDRSNERPFDHEAVVDELLRMIEEVDLNASGPKPAGPGRPRHKPAPSGLNPENRGTGNDGRSQELLSHAMPTPTFEKPKILLVDTPAEAHTSLQQAGFNAQRGTFGRVLITSEPRRQVAVWTGDQLPNHTEQEVVFVDLTPQRISISDVDQEDIVAPENWTAG